MLRPIDCKISNTSFTLFFLSSSSVCPLCPRVLDSFA